MIFYKEKISKVIGVICLVILLLIIFVSPVRNFMNSLFHRDKDELKEEQVIGTISGYNPRIKEVQEVLKEAGFEPGGFDGMMGQQTRRAIKEFQKAKGLRPTGTIDSTTYLALNREKEMIRSTSQTATKEEKIKPQDIKKKAEIQDEIMSYRLKSKDRIKQIQIALKKAGFYKGEIDGKVGPQTRRAIIAFQKSQKLKPDGIVGSKTWEELNKYLKD